MPKRPKWRRPARPRPAHGPREPMMPRNTATGVKPVRQADYEPTGPGIPIRVKVDDAFVDYIRERYPKDRDRLDMDVVTLATLGVAYWTILPDDKRPDTPLFQRVMAQAAGWMDGKEGTNERCSNLKRLDDRDEASALYKVAYAAGKLSAE